MKKRVTTSGILEVGLAIAYGAVVGSWLPSFAPAPLLALPAVVVTLPAPREPAPGPVAAVEPAEILPASWSPVERPGAALAATGAMAGRVGGWSGDTLPAAPRTAVAPLGWISGPPRSSIGENGSGRTTAGVAAGRGGCPAIIAEGDPVPPGCRGGARRATRACPRPGEPIPAGAVVCIRAED